MPTTEAQKRAMAKWKAKNHDKYESSVKKAKKLWRQNHKEEYLAKNNIYVHTSISRWKDYNTETRRLRKILFDGYIPLN